MGKVRAKKAKTLAKSKNSREDTNEEVDLVEEDQIPESPANGKLTVEERFKQGESDEEDEGSDESDEEIDDEEEDLPDEDEEPMLGGEDQQLMFDFEALPPDPEDRDGIVDLMTQVFLRIDVNTAALARRIIAQSPFGCVFKPAEEFEDEEAESIVYGVVSIVPLNNSANLLGTAETEAYREPLTKYLLQKANKFAPKALFKKLKSLLEIRENSEQAENVGLVVNERLLHFPVQVSGPALQSLREDYQKITKKGKKKSIQEEGSSSNGELRNSSTEVSEFSYFLMILKIRIGESSSGVTAQRQAPGKKRKLTKAEKKRARMEAANANIHFDNAEEALLFKNDKTVSTSKNPTVGSSSAVDTNENDAFYFDFSVESDVESGSKFHRIRRGGVVYAPYRRVCLLTPNRFTEFVDRVLERYPPA